MRAEEFGAGAPDDGLSDHDKAVIDFAKTAPRLAGTRVNAIREQFNYGETTYFMKLNRLLDDPKAMEYDPHTIQRYQRIREDRMVKRTPTGGYQSAKDAS